MNLFGKKSLKALSLSTLMWAGVVVDVMAYPPAPPHTIYGAARRESGELIDESASIVFKTDAGVTVQGTISPGIEPGVNYEVVVPMDANTVLDEPYLDNALTPLVPFRISVIIGTTTNLPIQMQGDFQLLGEEGQKTRIDLTLGVDSDGDGLPDAWEQFLIDLLGGDLTLADIDPAGDNDGDGMTNYGEYIAGTYAFDAEDVFKLYPTERTPEVAIYQFLGIGGRTYGIQASDNLGDWQAVAFSVPATGANQVFSYSVSSVKTVTVEIVSTNQASFYRGVVE